MPYQENTPGQNQTDPLKEAPDTAETFTGYVSMVRRELGVRNVEHTVQLGLETDPSLLSPEQLLEAVWNKKAADWIGVETQTAYYATMQTLLHYMNLQKAGNQQIVSVGSGPGLYELYLATLFEKRLGKHRPTIVCTDFSEEMTRIQRNIHSITKAKEGVVLDRVRMETQNMTNLRMKTKSVDQLICNNTLQWVPNWRQAIKEMAQVITPTKTGYLYIFLNENPMTSLSTAEGETVLELPNAPIDEIIETFEQNRFQVVASRHLTSPDGQDGYLQRRFFMAEYRAMGKIQPWKSVQPSQLGTSYTFTKKR